MKKRTNASWLDESNLSTFGIVICSVLVIWVILVVIFILLFFNGKVSGGLDDTVGIVNSIFAALAFAGLFFTIMLQRKELRETREELKKQNRTLVVQRFETILFNMLTLHHETVNNLKDIDGKEVGRKILLDIIAAFSLETVKSEGRSNERVEEILRGQNEQEGNEDFKNLVNKLIEKAIRSSGLKTAYSETIKRHNFIINHYLKSIVVIYKFINESKLIADHRRKHYNEIFASYISDPEIAFLMYHDDLSESNSLNDTIRELVVKLGIKEKFNAGDYNLSNYIDINLFKHIV